MANVVINDIHLTNIAAAIRGKNGTSNTYAPKDMAAAITNLPSGGSGGGDLAYATITHNTSSTSVYYRTFDLTNYISSGTIYFITQYGSAPNTYVCIIENGVMTDVRYGTSGSIFAVGVSNLTYPNFEFANGIMKVSGSTTSTYYKDSANVIYTA